MDVTLFRLHDREQDHCLVPLGYVCLAISPIQQQAMTGRQVRSPPHDLFKRGPFASAQELPIQGGISAFGQVWGYRWVVKKPGP
jgi:hypothetical protein